MMFSAAVSFLLVLATASSSPLQHRFGPSAKNLTVKPSECGYCTHYYDTGNSPYHLLMIISKTLDPDAESVRDDLLMDSEELKHAEKLFNDYCERHCLVGRRSLGGLGNAAGAAAADSSPPPVEVFRGNALGVATAVSQQSPPMAPPPVVPRESATGASSAAAAAVSQQSPPMAPPPVVPRGSAAAGASSAPAPVSQQVLPMGSPMEVPQGSGPGAAAAAAASQPQTIIAEDGISSGAVVSGFDTTKTGGSGTAALTGYGATLLGGGLGDEGDVQGSVSTDDRGQITFTGGVDEGGYVAGAMSQGGSASGSSSVNEQGTGTVSAAVENGGTAFGMTGGKTGSVSGNLEQNALTGESSATLFSTKDTGAGAISGVGAGVSGSSSVATTNESDDSGLSIISKDVNSTITGVLTLGEASVSGSGSMGGVAGSVATSGGKGSVASASGVAAASSSFANSSLTNAVSSGGGFAGGSIVTGDAAGTAVSSEDAIASSVSGNTGTGIGSSTSGNSSSSGLVKDGAVIASASTVAGLASSVTTTGKGVAGGSGAKTSGVSMGVVNQHGSASGSATGKGASVATSTGHRAFLTLMSSKKKGTMATAIGSRFLHQQPEKSRKVKILRIHCDEEFCRRFPLELCCEYLPQQEKLR